ncbi:hypothetical protein TSOC_007261 [Tetrabaena socialis]|uniref:Primase C-terminal 2 domain-containing protein n=1 Tax=Tetrabaena socialis TaxID=47790 RepID=A0A2J8A1K7_9CHLO|nr:hypothetical protein TSOC_007261 [Tetrabaena socialis]|eukprot:PNH06390.1 hypothetical protein TSOC_007261 [Tetrabaena socialis]
MEETKKGRHYFFRRPDYCDAEGYFDGARQISGVVVDFKSVCTSGTVDGGPTDDLFIRDLVSCLLPATSINRAEWVKVGHILKREGMEYFQLWNDFSATAGTSTNLYKGTADCQKTWDSFNVANHDVNRSQPITIASLCFMAERDDPSPDGGHTE